MPIANSNTVRTHPPPPELPLDTLARGEALHSLLEELDDLDHPVIWPEQDCSVCTTHPTAGRAVNILPLQKLGAIRVIDRPGGHPELRDRVLVRRDAWL